MDKSYSVLMSVYNKEKSEYLRQAIESMLSQSVPAKEIVIVCDGPLTGELDEVISEYCNTHEGLFNIVRLSENIGLSGALNHGIDECSFDIIARMDSDDISRSDRMEKELSLMEREDADIVGSDVTEFSGDERNIISTREVPHTFEEIKDFAPSRNPFNHPSVVFKKSAVVSCGKYEDYRYFEDYNLWVTMISKGFKGVNVAESLVNMRAGSDMYKRRGGFAYAKYMKNFRRHMLDMGMLDKKTYITTTAARCIMAIVPTGIRKWVYSKKLRS